MMAGGSFLFSCNKKEAPFLGRLPQTGNKP